MTPFEAALGARFHHLMPQLRQLHGGRAEDWAGQVSVQTKPGLLGQVARRLAGFPGDMHNAPFAIRITQQADGSEIWVRDFDGHILRSKLRADDQAGLIRETIGPSTVVLKPEVKVDALHVSVQSAQIFGAVSLPQSLALRSDVVIWQDEAGRYRFDIKASLRFVGQFIRYTGWLRPAVQSGFVTR